MDQKVLTEVEIRNLYTVPELELVRKLEAKVWSFEDSVPVNQTITVVKNGGFILGAFLHNQLIGFQYSFPGFDGKSVYLCSHSLGIHPDYRKFGIGEKLKWAQKELALEKGYDLIKWTYDPLETVNGNLNLHKLGAICSTYIEDAYGQMEDGLNSGIATDRFLVEWRVEEMEANGKRGIPSKVGSFASSKREIILQNMVLQTESKNGSMAPSELNLGLDAVSLFVPVPGNFQTIKSHDFQLAVNWRNVTRKIFTTYLGRGWQVTDLVKDRFHEDQYLYVLERGGKDGNKPYKTQAD